MYLNQLPPTEVARLKAELAETLIANFCYPRFYDYRASALRMRPVDRVKRQEVWQYLNAVDFNVWGRVDLDSPEFQRQVERLFILFVQRNRNFFGEQGRKRMTDVRQLITSCSNALAEGLRGHLQGQQFNPPFGSPRSIVSWSMANSDGRSELSWEQILPGTMQLQQQLQELRGEVRSAPTPVPPAPANPISQAGPAVNGSAPARRSRSIRSTVGNSTSNGNGNGSVEDGALAWSTQNSYSSQGSEGRIAASFRSSAQPAAFSPQASPYSAPSNPTEANPTLPLPLSSPDMPTVFQPAVTPEVALSHSGRQKRVRPEPASSASAFAPGKDARKTTSQPLPALAPAQSMPMVSSQADVLAKSVENNNVLTSDEDVVIFEQMRYQLFVWLRVEAVRSGLELSNQGAFELIAALSQQDENDAARLQVVSTLLNMCEQIINTGQATLFDYKQAMMFYLMHTRRSR